MNKDLAKLIAGNKGRMVAYITALLMGGITQFITSKGFRLEGELAVAISSAIAFLSGWLIDTAAARINAVGITQMQDAIPELETDGYAGKKTIRAVTDLAYGVTTPRQYGEQVITLEEGQEIKRHLHEISRRRPDINAALRQALEEIKGGP